MSGSPSGGFGLPSGYIITGGLGAPLGDAGTATNISNLVIKRGFEGPQLILRWDLPTVNFNSITLVRKRYDFPKTIDDGLVLQTGTFTEYVDTEIIHAEVFYYSIFVTVGTDIFLDEIDSRVKGIGFETGESVKLLLDCLATVHKVSDIGLIPLPESVNPSDKTFQSSVIPSGEKFHINELPNEEFGQLSRLLRLFGNQLDSYNGELDYLETNIADPKNISCNLLEALSGVVGLEFNAELSATEQRLEIINAIPLYKIKGTLGSVKQLTETILGTPVNQLEATVVEKHRTVLISNQFHRRSLNPSVCTFINWGKCADKTCYSWTDELLTNERLDRVQICITPDQALVLDPAKIKKIVRILDDFLPATIRGGLLIDEPVVEDDYDVSATVDTFNDFIDADLMAEWALLRQGATLRSGILQRTSNSIPNGRSASESGIGEQYFDVITHA